VVRRESWRASDLRRNIRHISSLPVECRREGETSLHRHQLKDICHGGLGLVATEPVQQGDVYQFYFPGLDYSEPVRGEVVWSRQDPDSAQAGYEAGVRFIEDSPYSHARLVVDVCHVEYYRRDQRRHGRQLAYEQAVTEWKQRLQKPAVN
jgi:hypothetical protein